MTPERWRRIDDIYNEALEREPASRARFLDTACDGDAELRREVDSLLAASRQTAFTLDRPAMEVAAESLAKDPSTERVRDTEPGQTISLGERYVVLGEAGRGGMGIVYRVQDRETEEIIAVKVLHGDIASNQFMLDHFKDELKLSRRVTHRNVCRIYDINRNRGLTYISMEFVEGESLRRLLNRLGALTVRKAVDLIRQICEGVREAHAQGVIHRDLKPENIMIDSGGNAKIMDFGIARLLSKPRTVTTYLAGTPSYMSPEQLAGQKLDERSDIYSLGLVAYEILTGRAAYAGNTPVAIAAQQMREAPPAPRTIDPLIPAEVEAVVLQCLEKDTARRYQSLDDVLAALPASRVTGGQAGVVKPRTTKISNWFEETAQIMAPGKARALLLLIQAGYLGLYLAVLYHLDAAFGVLENQMGFSPAASRLLPVLGMVGIATRIYLVSTLAFNHPATGRQYWKLFPVLLVLDAVWAASPLLLAPRIGIGLALVFTVAMAYLPFSQKTLFSNAYR